MGSTNRHSVRLAEKRARQADADRQEAKKNEVRPLPIVYYFPGLISRSLSAAKKAKNPKKSKRTSRRRNSSKKSRNVNAKKEKKQLPKNECERRLEKLRRIGENRPNETKLCVKGEALRSRYRWPRNRRPQKQLHPTRRPAFSYAYQMASHR